MIDWSQPHSLAKVTEDAGFTMSDVAFISGLDESTISRLWDDPHWLDRVKGRSLQALVASVPGVAEYFASHSVLSRRDKLISQLEAKGLQINHQALRLSNAQRVPHQYLINALEAALRIMQGDGARTCGLIVRFWGIQQNRALEALYSPATEVSLLRNPEELVSASLELVPRLNPKTYSFHTIITKAHFAHHLGMTTGEIAEDLRPEITDRQSALMTRSGVMGLLITSNDTDLAQRYERMVATTPVLSVIEEWAFPTYARDSKLNADFSVPGSLLLRRTAAEVIREIGSYPDAYIYYLVTTYIPLALSQDQTFGLRIQDLIKAISTRVETCEDATARNACLRLSQVLVEGGLITSVSAGNAPPPGSDDALVIEGTGRTLIPGLIDAHWHSAFATLSIGDAITADVGYLHLAAGRCATETLHRGFTTVRDAGGPTFGLKRAIDTGLIAGPRIFPSGAFISQSGGHGDFRMPYETPKGVHGCLSHTELIGGSIIADGVEAVLRAAREQLMHGASQLKVMAGGGVSSNYDPLDVTQYTAAEMRAAVEAAENWGTYVMVHAFSSRAVRQALEAGVRSIDHGHLIDEETVELIAEKDAWWCLQPFLDDEDAIPETGANRLKAKQVYDGTDRSYALAKKHGIKVAWGTDTLFDRALSLRQGAQLAKMVRWYTPAEVLTMATLQNAELLSLSGLRNPYPGTLGVVESGAIADLLLIDGDPLEDITLLARPESSMLVIMKGGEIVKSQVSA